MTAPIDKAAEALVSHGGSTFPDLYEGEALDVARAVFTSIDTDELARALAPWLGTGQSANNAAEAVKAHLLKEDS